MPVFIIPGWVMVSLMFMLWAVVAWKYWAKAKYQPRIENYFAQRRHDRRMRNRAMQESAMTLKLDVNTIRKPKVYNAPARHRR